MPRRTGLGDETWNLALARDTGALDRAARLLIESELTYDGHRARAFSLSVQGDVDGALAELNDGWTEESPFPAVYAADIARIRYLAGDYERSLGALRLAAYRVDRLDPAVATSR